MVAHLLWEQRVAGSNPVIPKNVLSSVVERWFPKPNVVGSTPTGRVDYRRYVKAGPKAVNERLNTKDKRSRTTVQIFVDFFVLISLDNLLRRDKSPRAYRKGFFVEDKKPFTGPKG